MVISYTINDCTIEALEVELERIAIACRYIYRNAKMSDVYVVALYNPRDDRFKDTLRFNNIKSVVCMPYAHELEPGQVIISGMILPGYGDVITPQSEKLLLDTFNFDFKDFYKRFDDKMLTKARLYWEETLPKEIDETIKEFENIDIDIRR